MKIERCKAEEPPLEDFTSPTFVYVDPRPHAMGIEAGGGISIHVVDNVLLDSTSIVLRYNGTVVQPTVTMTDTALRQLEIEYRAPAGFAPGDTVRVGISISDWSDNSASMDYWFSVAEYIAKSSQPGLIVPDGYWRDDPTKPLEVRDLPAGWTVRIVSTAGAQVRTFKNNRPDDMTWIWDFKNNSGRRVVRSLYLVQVIDGNGITKRSGRFMVHY